MLVPATACLLCGRGAKGFRWCLARQAAGVRWSAAGRWATARPLAWRPLPGNGRRVTAERLAGGGDGVAGAVGAVDDPPAQAVDEVMVVHEAVQVQVLHRG